MRRQREFLRRWLGVAAATSLSGASASSDERTLVRWSFWVPAERMEEMAPVFDAEIAPILARHGFVDPRPDTRVVPDGLFNRVYAVSSRQSFEVMRDAVETDPLWLELMEELGERFERMGGDGRLTRFAAPYSDPAGPGTRRYAPPGKVVPVGPGHGHWTTYGVPDGLPSLDLPCLYEDRSGNIWVCSFGSGLSRWDGSQFESFDIQAEADLTSPSVYLTYEDRRGHLWFPAPWGWCATTGRHSANTPPRTDWRARHWGGPPSWRTGAVGCGLAPTPA
jgi:hypothetical protein